MSPLLLLKVQRHSPSILTSLSARWLHSLALESADYRLNANNAHNQPFNSFSSAESALVTMLCNNYWYSRVGRGEMKKFPAKQRDPVAWCSHLQEWRWVNNRRRDELLALLAVSGSEMGMSILSEGSIFQSISSKNTICFTLRVLCWGWKGSCCCHALACSWNGSRLTVQGPH